MWERWGTEFLLPGQQYPSNAAAKAPPCAKGKIEKEWWPLPLAVRLKKSAPGARHSAGCTTKSSSRPPSASPTAPPTPPPSGQEEKGTPGYTTRLTRLGKWTDSLLVCFCLSHFNLLKIHSFSFDSFQIFFWYIFAGGTLSSKDSLCWRNTKRRKWRASVQMCALPGQIQKQLKVQSVAGQHSRVQASHKPEQSRWRPKCANMARKRATKKFFVGGVGWQRAGDVRAERCQRRQQLQRFQQLRTMRRCDEPQDDGEQAENIKIWESLSQKEQLSNILSKRSELVPKGPRCKDQSAERGEVRPRQGAGDCFPKIGGDWLLPRQSWELRRSEKAAILCDQLWKDNASPARDR